MQLTKKQRKALQFRGKLEKPEKDDRPEKPAVEKKPSKKSKKDTTTDTPAPPAEKKFVRKTNNAGNAVRFIVFVGNLPFKSTVEEVREFMKAANPTSVRLMTDKDTGKSRGFAFAEFGTAIDLKHALNFHHQWLGKKKINVELTAGGGGNSTTRKDKLDKRRKDLDKEREKERKTKRRKVDEEAGEAGEDAAETHDAAEEEEEEEEPEHADEAADFDAKSKKPNRRKRGRGSRQPTK
ncbi:hypothetical protein IW139_000019 [Coemansia sp. RSA 353]|nr:hypothetical protein GGH17_000086 [Coemansia sp. RSA 788]KAJ2169516.1 hypothetical protein GGH15_000530 [Coemansia sp. RSA 562]KAJ2191704.1 hypothetical protein EV181_000020 [Coemansia sp. RSA 532]KAJ2199613.1 hypothetical protein GGH18_000394 [Coemansia sp. RSA 530]KAJ2201678.1 hypothetical protein IW144_000020 [Coemansia sp. RSA 522]KAJ2209234.1 hypothetical protein IW145_000020 [Coemansia sp. RSA 521]KAJ2231816.1 hypothetical protein EV180_000020 [Coemansia sp. RSA 518]KAJ2284328.1 hyp